MRLQAIPCLLIAACSFAQSPTDVFDKAPPEIDKALRERVDIFIQAHIEGKFRRAEQVIHADSQDEFYNAEKQRLISYQITKITYSEKFTHATVMSDVELDWATPRTGKIRVKPPMKSVWKLENGQWWWYAPPRVKWETPFGEMRPAPETAPGAPVAPQIRMVDPNAILARVQADKSEIKLDSVKASEDSAHISADIPGEVRLEVQPHRIPGLTVSFENQTIRQGSPATIRFKYTPPDATAKTAQIVYIHANPLGKVFSFTLDFAPPPVVPTAPIVFPGKLPAPAKK
ncbi:MAG: hypothetical protein SGI92_15405 [Bryobacteraceae bacterium]|nr:hypothetical protein [Bryobacteraceae bacterium]